MFEEPVVESPCVKVCQLDNVTGLCKGCYRTPKEIQGWWELSFEQKAEVIKKTWVRQEKK